MTDKINILVPDLGGASSVDVIEILVAVGDIVAVDTPLLTLESDKASMEIPSSHAGRVTDILVKLGDKVKQGDTIVAVQSLTQISEPAITEPKTESAQAIPVVTVDTIVAAGPATRRFAREQGVDLQAVVGTGRKNRINLEDVQNYVNHQGGNKVMETLIPLSKIKRLTAKNLHNAWLTVPQVTQFEQADITELEDLRQQLNQKNPENKLTMLAFVCKVVTAALQKFPQFNSSLDASGENLIVKSTINIGIAVETPDGLVVPVIKDCQLLSISAIAQKMAELSQKARKKTLLPLDMQGGTFTISSLGGIGGTAFTPIVNYPEVAILGLSRAKIQAVYQQGVFTPRLLLPLSLSYDHRVIDGAEGARFVVWLAEHMQDIRKILL